MAGGSEIERKFLVRELPAGLRFESEEEIRQGYLALDGDTEVRLRLASGGATLTIKHGRGRVRAEEELQLDADRAARLWRLTEGRRVEKLRRRARMDGALLEIDLYAGALEGLAVAEVEFGDERAADAFEPPAWLGPEVTDDPAYKNRALACAGLPGGARWPTA